MEEQENTIQTNYAGYHTLEHMAKDTLCRLYELAGRFPISNDMGTFKITIEFYREGEEDEE